VIRDQRERGRSATAAKSTTRIPPITRPDRREKSGELTAVLGVGVNVGVTDGFVVAVGVGVGVIVGIGVAVIAAAV
jgi:hypothetical protein